jgi:comEA protein
LSDRRDRRGKNRLTQPRPLSYDPLPLLADSLSGAGGEWASSMIRLTNHNGGKAARQKREEVMKKLLLALALCFALSGIAAATVNINTATKEELTSIKGIGDKRAQDIIDYRKKNGDFKSIDDLEKVPGIGPGTMKQIRSELSVTGKTVVNKSADKGSKAQVAQPAKSKAAEVKKAEPAKGDAMKADTAKAKTTEKAKTDEKKVEKK